MQLVAQLFTVSRTSGEEIQQGIQTGNPFDSIEVLFRLYNRFGLALAEEYNFHTNRSPAFIKIRSIDTGRRQAIDSP
jgi:hypothetical protein